MDDFIGRLAANAGVHGEAAAQGRPISPLLHLLGKTQLVSASAQSPVVDSRLD
jgi:hypothetical protein